MSNRVDNYKLNHLNYKIENFHVVELISTEEKHECKYINLNLNDEESIVLIGDRKVRHHRLPLFMQPKGGFLVHNEEIYMYNAIKLFKFNQSKYDVKYPLDSFWWMLQNYFRENRITEDKLNQFEPFIPSIKYHHNYDQIEEEENKKSLLEVEKYKEKQKGYKTLLLNHKFPFGQYKGKIIKDVCDSNPDYILYLSGGGTKIENAAVRLAEINSKYKKREMYKRKY